MSLETLTQEEMAKAFLKDKARKRAYSKARQNAVQILIKNHSSEFSNLLSKERKIQEYILLAEFGGSNE